MKFRLLLPIMLLFFACVAQTGADAKEISVFRASDGKTITFEEMIKELRGVQIVFVGETHNQEPHHRLQLEIIKALHSPKRPMAVGFEMFTADSQETLDMWTSGKISLDRFLPVYYKNWNFPWPLYRDILLYVRDHRLPSVGLNLPPDITRRVSQSGFASLTEEELKKLPPETGCVVSREYMEFIRRAYAMHGHNGKRFQFFCEAQLLWDQVMARNLVDYLRKNPDRAMVVLTGNGHAWKLGIPDQVRSLPGKFTYKVVLPEIPGHIDPQHTTIADTDYIILLPY
ncbi:MAG: ChaN family lipoprotein [Nitrospirota bacterium]